MQTNVDLSRMRINGREYVNADLEKTLRVTSRNDLIVDVLWRDYTMSYKMPFLLSFLERMDRRTSSAPIDDMLDGYAAFYADLLARGLAADRASCPYTPAFLRDRKAVRASMLANLFEKFERKRFMYHSRDLGQISLNHALLARLDDSDYARIRSQLQQDLIDYYAKL